VLAGPALSRQVECRVHGKDCTSYTASAAEQPQKGLFAASQALILRPRRTAKVKCWMRRMLSNERRDGNSRMGLGG